MSEPTCVAPMLLARQSPSRCQCRECLREAIAVLEQQLEAYRERVEELLGQREELLHRLFIPKPQEARCITR